jgi:hypothetical protein
MFLHVTSVTHLGQHELRLEFSDGSTKDVDLSGELHGGVFEPLRDPELFRQGTLDPETGTVEWPNGADFAPESLHQIGRPVQQVA